MSRIDASGGRVSAVETTDGRRVAARRAVVSSAHLATMAGMVSSPTPDLLAARDTWRPGLSLFAVHAGLKKDITFPTATGPVLSTAGGLGTAAGLQSQLEAFERGEPDARDPWMLLVASTVVDPDRALVGGGTFKILTVAPHDRADSRPWDGGAGLEHAHALMDRVHERTDCRARTSCRSPPRRRRPSPPVARPTSAAPAAGAKS